MTDDRGPSTDEGVERRRFLKGAMTVAWATPLVLTMTARQAGAQAMSCIPNGAPCDACTGMNCCDASGPADGGCCCSDPNVPECGGVCVAVDANCTSIPSPGHPGDTFVCYAPAPVTTISTVGRSRVSSGKGAKS